jgi:hypothetical protein
MQITLTYMQMILNFGNICILAYTLYRFLSKPHDTLEQKVHDLEGEVEKLKTYLKNDFNRLENQDVTNEVLIHSVLALIEFEMNFCLVEEKPMSEDLKAAKKDLSDFLARAKK